jgi:hypothetical protein
MTASDFRAIASRCNRAARNCSDPFAKEEFRRLAYEFDVKADELDHLPKASNLASPHPAWRGLTRLPPRPGSTLYSPAPTTSLSETQTLP